MKIELVSPLPLDECVARLMATIDRASLVSYLPGSKSVVGRIAGMRVLLRKQNRYHNSFQPFLTGTFELDIRGGTVFRGSVGMHPIVQVFMAGWFGMVILINILWAFIPVIRWLGGVPLPEGVIYLLLMLVFGVMFVVTGRFIARRETEFLVAFLTTTLDVRGE